jgi:flagellar export protein FliJ
MKRFDFHLEQVLRWKTAMADLRKAEALACANAVADAEREVERLRTEQTDVAREFAKDPNSCFSASYAAFLERTRRRIASGLKRVEQARAALKAATEKLVEADRNAKLLEKMKETRLREWNEESAKELEAFAAETFLNRR